jgi:hypothetical protein
MHSSIAPSGSSTSGHLSAGPGGYGPPPGGFGGGGGYGPPQGGGGYGAPPPGGFGPPGGPPPPGGFGGPPGGLGPSGYGGDRMMAESKIKAPAIVMIVFTVIGILLQLFSLSMNILGTGMHVANEGGVDQIMSGAVGIVMNIVGLLAGAFCTWAFFKMMKLQSRGLAMTAVIFSMLPCLGSCWCINLWVGIWALIVLNDENVKASFQ